MDFHAYVAELFRERGEAEFFLRLVLLIGDAVEGLVGPLVVPIDGAAVDNRREHPASVSQFLADRGEGQHDMEVFTHELHEIFQQRLPGVDYFRVFIFLREYPHVREDFLVILRRPEVRDLPDVQQIIDILEETFLHNLRVRKQEHLRVRLRARVFQQFLQILLPLRVPIALRYLYRKALKSPNIRRQPRQRLPPRAAHTNQQIIPPILPQRPTQPRQVLYGVHEKHQIHFLRILRIIIIQIVIEFIRQRVHILDFTIFFIHMHVVAEQ